jgi:hypothetical protein
MATALQNYLTLTHEQEIRYWAHIVKGGTPEEFYAFTYERVASVLIRDAKEAHETNTPMPTITYL